MLLVLLECHTVITRQKGMLPEIIGMGGPVLFSLTELGASKGSRGNALGLHCKGSKQCAGICVEGKGRTKDRAGWGDEAVGYLVGHRWAFCT